MEQDAFLPPPCPSVTLWFSVRACCPVEGGEPIPPLWYLVPPLPSKCCPSKDVVCVPFSVSPLWCAVLTRDFCLLNFVSVGEVLGSYMLDCIGPFQAALACGGMPLPAGGAGSNIYMYVYIYIYIYTYTYTHPHTRTYMYFACVFVKGDT